MDRKKIKSNVAWLTLVVMITAMCSILNSCKKDTADTADLLATVPSSSGVVAGVNLKSIIEKTGCEINGTNVKPGKEVEAWINGLGNDNSSLKNIIQLILTGESGIDPTVAVYFADAYNSYLTFSLSDTSKFEEIVKNNSGEEFEKQDNDVSTCGNVAVKGAQAWICVSSYNTIDSKAVANYSTLDSNQSFLQNPYSSHISSMSGDVAGWGNLKLLSRSNSPIPGFSSINMISGMLFENAAALSMSLEFLKGKLEITAEVLDADGKTSKYLLPAAKVDTSTIKSIGGNAQLVGAISITKDLTKKIEKMASSLGGNMLGGFMDVLKPIDGTVAFAGGSLDNPGSQFSGVITTDGNPTREFMAAVSELGDTRKDGKDVWVSKGSVSGDIDVAKAAEALSGNTLGLMLNLQNAPTGDMNVGGMNLADAQVMKTLIFGLEPQGAGLKLNLTLESIEPSENVLITLIRKDTK